MRDGRGKEGALERDVNNVQWRQQQGGEKVKSMLYVSIYLPIVTIDSPDFSDCAVFSLMTSRTDCKQEED